MLSALISPARDQAIFAIKTCCALLLALSAALYFQLERPYWALLTVVIVANPIAGAAGSKAVYRLGGTIIGGLASVILLPNLIDDRVLFIAAISSWVGFCLAASLLDRTPRGYLYMLAGYTAVLTSFPLVDQPQGVLLYAISRVIEIGVGILSVLIIDKVVFPRDAGAVAMQRISNWTARAATQLREALLAEPNGDPNTSLSDKLASEASEIRSFLDHTAYDPGGRIGTRSLLREMHQAMIALLPLVSAISDGASALRLQRDHLTLAASTMINDAVAWLAEFERYNGLCAESGEELAKRLEGIARQGSETNDWESILLQNLAARLLDAIIILEGWRGLLIQAERGHRKAIDYTPSRHSLGSKHRDYPAAIAAGVGAALAVAVPTTFWILTAWQYGNLVAMLSAISASFFASLDDPTIALKQFLKVTAFVAVSCFAFQFAVMPILGDFPALLAALGIFVFPMMLLLNEPRAGMIGLMLLLLVPNVLTMPNIPVYDATTYIESAASLVLGFLSPLVVFKLVKSVNHEIIARRLLRAAWADVANAASFGRPADFSGLAQREIDRLALLQARIGAISNSSDISHSDLLRDLRVGYQVLALRAILPAASAEGNSVLPIKGVLSQIAHYFRERRRSLTHLPAPDALREEIDQVLSTLAADQRSKARNIRVPIVAGAVVRMSVHVGSKTKEVDEPPPVSVVDPLVSLAALRVNLFPNDPPPAEFLSDQQKVAVI